MRQNQLRFAWILASLVGFSACTPLPVQQKSPPPNTQQMATLNVRFLSPKPKVTAIEKDQKGFHIKFIEPTDIFHGNGFVTGNGIAVPIAPSAPTNPFQMPKGSSAVDVTFTPVPVGNNRVVTVTGLDSTQTPIATHYQIKGVTNVISPGPNAVTISFQTTPTARVIEKLIADAHPTANTIDFTTIQALVDRLVNNDTALPTDDIHPSLVDHNAIATYIETNGAAPNPPGPLSVPDRDLYTFTPGTISGVISGVQEPYKLGVADETVFPPLTIVSNDPASQLQNISAQVLPGLPGSIGYTITNVTPGTNYTVTVQPAYHVKKTASVNVAEGATTTQNFVFAAGDKRQWFPNAIAGHSNQVWRYQAAAPIDILIVKPVSSAADWNTTDHLDAVNYAINQIKTLYGTALTIGAVHEVFEDDPGFNAPAPPMPPLGSAFDPNPAGPNSPNNPANLNTYLVGKYDLYVRWRTDFCPGVTIGRALMAYSNPTNFTTSIELATHFCGSGVIPYDIAREVAAHEITHALGGTDHSPTTTDVMFPTVNTSQLVNLNPSINDINTVRFLYNANPTTTNTDRDPVAPPPPIPSITMFAPRIEIIGSTITITGINFLGATAVRFNGLNAASFTVVDNNTITAVVPPGVTIGPLTVTTPFGVATSSQSFVYVPNLVAWWKFDEGAGVTAVDSSGNGNNGTINGSPTWSSGATCKSDMCMDFDGIDDVVVVNSPTGVPFGNGNRTVLAWIYPIATTSMWGVVQYGNMDCNSLMFGLAYHGFTSFWGGCNDYVSSIASPQNQWFFEAMVYNGAQVQVWGNTSFETAAVGALNTQPSNLFIGGETVNNGASFRNRFNGRIDHVQVYNRALTPAEITAIYNATN